MPGLQEIAVIRGALDLTSKTAANAMTPLDKVCYCRYCQLLSAAILHSISHLMALFGAMCSQACRWL